MSNLDSQNFNIIYLQLQNFILLENILIAKNEFFVLPSKILKLKVDEKFKSKCSVSL